MNGDRHEDDVRRVRVTCPRCNVNLAVSEKKIWRTDGPGHITIARCVFCGFVFTATATDGDKPCDT